MPLNQPQIPNKMTITPLSQRDPGGVDGTVLGGLITKINSVFAKMDPPPPYDTDIELRTAVTIHEPTFAGGANYYTYMTERLTLAQSRKKMFEEFTEVEDQFPEVGSALDIYADNVVSTDSYSEDIVNIVTDDERVGAIFLVLKDLLKIDKGIWTRAREIVRIGEHFDEVVYDAATMFPDRLKALPPMYMMRNEDGSGVLPLEKAFSQVDDSYQTEASFARWQILHYRMLRRPDDTYGTGLLYPIRALCKKLGLAEDAILIARLTRAHKKLAFKIPVDGVPFDKRKQYINDIKREFRKRRVINPRTNKLDLEANPLAAEDDFFIGSTKENPLDVQEIGGDTSLGDLNDIDFWQRKLFSALKVPPAYLGIEKDINAKATLTEQDVQFARTVHRVQMALQDQIRELLNHALILVGIDPSDVDYDITFPAISLIDELRNWEIEALKLQAAMQFADLFRPSDFWMLTNYLGFTTEEANGLLAEQQELPEEPEPNAPPPNSEDNNENELTREERRFVLDRDIFGRAKYLQNALGSRKKKREIAAQQKVVFERLKEESRIYRRVARRRALSLY